MNIYEHNGAFTINKYYRIYYKIILNALQQNRTKLHFTQEKYMYYELHHILPKCVFPEYANIRLHPWNSVLLTSKEHILIHLLLCYFTKGDIQKSCMRAFHCMCFKNNGGRNIRIPTIRHIAKAREYIGIANSGSRGSRGVPEWSKCTTMNEFKELLECKVRSNMSDPVIALELGVSTTAIHMWRHKLGITNRRILLRDKNWLSDQYLNKLMSASEISKVIGCTATAVQLQLSKFSIIIRNASERQKLKHIAINDRA